MAYLGRSPSQGVRNRYYKTASGGETSISGALTGGTLTFTDGNYVDVNLNGVTLVAGTDYNTSTANTIAGLSALTANDVVEIVVYDVFSVFSGNVNSDFSVGGNLTVTGTVEPAGDTSAGDNAAIGYTAAEGLILTGQGSTSDVVIKNDADTTVCFVPTGTDDLKFNDTARIIMGTGDDLQIIHDGSNSIISDNGTGNLVLRSDAQAVEIDFNTNETAALFKHNGSVELYHDNSKKFETTSTGVDITGGFTATDGSTITTTGNEVQLTLKSTDADAVEGPTLDLIRDSASPAASDNIGLIRYIGEDSAGNATVYAEIHGQIENPVNGSEDAAINFEITKGSGRANSFKIAADEVVVNEDSRDVDFRVQSDENTHAFFLEASTGNVGMALDAPTLDSSLCGVSVPSGARLFQIHDTDGSCIKLTDPSSGVNRGAQFAIIGTDTFLNNCEAGTLIFGTGNTERGRFDSAGHLLIATAGGNQPSSSRSGVMIKDTSAGAFTSFSNTTNTSSHGVYGNTNGVVGSIQTTNSSTAFNTSSDYRLKENVEYSWDATGRLKQLKPARFNFIANADITVDGFLAHEVSSIVPEAITGTKDKTRDVTDAVLSSDGKLIGENIAQDDWAAGKLETKDAQGNSVDSIYPSDSTWTASHTEPVMQQIDQSKLVPLLVKTIQELEARIATLEAK